MKFRLNRRQRCFSLVPVALPIFVLIMGLTQLHVDAVLALVVVIELVVLALLMWRLGRVGVDLEDRQAVVHGLRTHCIAWDAVQAVVVKSAMGERQVNLITVHRHYRLRAPVSGVLTPDAAFDDKYAQVRSWWLAHRSSELPPTASIEAARVTIGQRLQLVASFLLGTYASLNLLVVLVTGGHDTISIVPATALAAVGTCLLYPARPALARSRRRVRRRL